ncbi:hypothetical protein [Geothrix sp. SG200]|uniref:hypothetical protein n=1 Tax=Geothrix sp. SG200 TaxID=2922865 RepID=UPI001FAD114B|nr:hypothetical protein [Geothrix sp. SG200]
MLSIFKPLPRPILEGVSLVAIAFSTGMLLQKHFTPVIAFALAIVFSLLFYLLLGLVISLHKNRGSA